MPETTEPRQGSQLLALSFDVAASPSISLKGPGLDGDSLPQPCGWGFGWYPAGDHAALVIKDPTSAGENAMAKVLRDWERFQSDIFVCHVHGAARWRTQEDTQPWVRSYAGRDWLFAHQGEVPAIVADRLLSRDNSSFEPVGRTDAERIFCWLLEELSVRKCRQLAELDEVELHDWLRALNDVGPINVVLSDGEDLLVYQDRYRTHPLYWRRQPAPQPLVRLESADLSVDLVAGGGGNRSVVIFASEPLSMTEWQPMYPGQALLVRLGAVRWDSHAGSAPIASAAPPNLRVRRKAVPQTLSVTHQTTYRYGSPVERSAHLFRLHPVHDPSQVVLEHCLEVSPAGNRQELEDVFGNRATSLSVETPFTEMIIRSSSLVRITPPGEGVAPLPRRVTLPFSWMPWQRQMMSPYLLPFELPETQLMELADFALSFARRQNFDLVETLAEINATIYSDFQYVTGSTHVDTTPFEVYASRKGVCQDFTNLLICLARLLGIPARYRVGYVATGDEPRHRAMSEASHAWAELFLPDVGWRGFDPTNGTLAGADHVRVACGRLWRDASPTSGTIYVGGGGETLEVQVRVEVVEGD